jgi:hypothetical protein
MDETMPNQEKDLEERILKEIKKHKLTDSEMNLVLKNLSKVDLEDRIPKIIDHSGNSRHIKVGYFTDTHMGNINFDEDLFLKCVNDFNKAKVDIIYTTGDIIDGCSGRDGAILEQNKLGLSAQVKYASDLLNLFDTKVYGITGNHELWSKNKLNQGLDAGDYLESKCRNYVNLGQMEADIDIGKKNVLKLYHGQDGCFDNKTEIMTENGWKLFKNLNKTDKVATINIKNNVFEWQLPTGYIDEEYEGDMFLVKQQSLDFFITPNHKLLVKKYDNRWGEHEFELIEIKDIANYSKQTWQVKKSGSGWEGKKIELINVTRLESKNKGMSKKMKHIGQQSIYDIAELMAWYVTEGHIAKNKSLCICQSLRVNPINHAQIIDLFNRLGFSVRGVGKDNKNICFHSTELCSWLIQQCGKGSRNKFLPKWLKEQPTDILKIVFDTMIKGDGRIKDKDSFGYTSISSKLRTDMTEIAIKIGYSVTEHGDSLSISKNNPTINHKPKRIHYKGRIYCVTVPNHTILVRKNGKICWSGNSSYAPGYRGMKLIESLGGGKKPKILLSGHTHKFLYMFQRNIHYMEGGTLEGQTEFMRGKKLMAHKGYSILDIYFNKDGIQKFIIDFKPKYD